MPLARYKKGRTKCGPRVEKNRPIGYDWFYWRVDIFDQKSNFVPTKKMLLVRYWEFGILSYLQNWIMQDE